jgi:hypothetical protein
MSTLRRITVPLALIVAVAASGLVLAAGPDPTPHQIYQAAEAGQLGQAEQMLDQVLADHPRSGEAHWVAAEIYARAGDFARARAELATAQTLEPGLPFVKKRADIGELEAQLSQGRIVQQAPNAPYGARRSGVPWGLILIAVSIVWIVSSIARRRRQLAGGYPQYPGQPGQPYPGQPMGMPPGGVPMGGAPYGYGPGPGSGLMGSIGTGLAVGAGVAAGEALVGRVLGGGQGGGVIPPANAEEIGPPPANGDMGGPDFGVSGDSWDGGGGGGDFGTGGDFGGGDGGGDWT